MKTVLTLLLLATPVAHASDAPVVPTEYAVQTPLKAGHYAGQGLLVGGVALGSLVYVSALTTPSRGRPVLMGGSAPLALTIGGLGMLSVGTSFALRDRRPNMLPMLGMAVGTATLAGVALADPHGEATGVAVAVVPPVVLGLGVVQVIANEVTARRHRTNQVRVSVAPVTGGGMAVLSARF